jgi:hypothetical protein
MNRQIKIYIGNAKIFAGTLFFNAFFEHEELLLARKITTGK